MRLLCIKQPISEKILATNALSDYIGRKRPYCTGRIMFAVAQLPFVDESGRTRERSCLLQTVRSRFDGDNRRNYITVRGSTWFVDIRDRKSPVPGGRARRSWDGRRSASRRSVRPPAGLTAGRPSRCRRAQLPRTTDDR